MRTKPRRQTETEEQEVAVAEEDTERQAAETNSCRRTSRPPGARRIPGPCCSVSQAEFDNYRRRNQNAREDAYNDGVRDTLEKFLPVLDNLERAAAAQGGEEALREGVQLVLKQFDHDTCHRGRGGDRCRRRSLRPEPAPRRDAGGRRGRGKRHGRRGAAKGLQHGRPGAEALHGKSCRITKAKSISVIWKWNLKYK